MGESAENGKRIRPKKMGRENDDAVSTVSITGMSPTKGAARGGGAKLGPL